MATNNQTKAEREMIMAKSQLEEVIEQKGELTSQIVVLEATINSKDDYIVLQDARIAEQAAENARLREELAKPKPCCCTFERLEKSMRQWLKEANETTLQKSLEDIREGRTQDVADVIDELSEQCDRCDGTGSYEGKPGVLLAFCKACRGTGVLTKPTEATENTEGES